MNLSYLKYAVEVEKTGAITKAAQNFYMIIFPYYFSESYEWM